MKKQKSFFIYFQDDNMMLQWKMLKAFITNIIFSICNKAEIWSNLPKNFYKLQPRWALNNAQKVCIGLFFDSINYSLLFTSCKICKVKIKHIMIMINGGVCLIKSLLTSPPFFRGKGAGGQIMIWLVILSVIMITVITI